VEETMVFAITILTRNHREVTVNICDRGSNSVLDQIEENRYNDEFGGDFMTCVLGVINGTETHKDATLIDYSHENLGVIEIAYCIFRRK
jgi:hypothetical protein